VRVLKSRRRTELYYTNIQYARTLRRLTSPLGRIRKKIILHSHARYIYQRRRVRVTASSCRPFNLDVQVSRVDCDTIQKGSTNLEKKSLAVIYISYFFLATFLGRFVFGARGRGDHRSLTSCTSAFALLQSFPVSRYRVSRQVQTKHL
jgi:hypothetical protein